MAICYLSAPLTISQPSREVMASGKITTNRAIETGTIAYTRTLGSGTLNVYACQKANGVVNAAARVYDISEPASGVFFKLPEGFRPRVSASGWGYVYYAGGGPIPASCFCHVDPSGNVQIPYTAAQTATQVGFAITFSV